MGDCGAGGTESLVGEYNRRSSPEEDGGAAEKRQRKEEEESGGGGGLVSQFISRIVSISGGTESGEVVEVEGTKNSSSSEDSKEEREDGSEGGGSIKQDSLKYELDLMSNTPLDVEFYEPREIETKEVDVKVSDAESGADRSSSRGNGSEGKVGAISDFVASLPHSISETGAPESDEASILIHSVVHD